MAMKSVVFVLTNLLFSLSFFALAKAEPSNSVLPGMQFSEGAITITIQENSPPCGASTRGYTWIEHDSTDLSDTGFDGLQIEIRKLAARIEAACTSIDRISISTRAKDSSDPNVKFELLEESTNWSLQSSMPSRDVQRAIQDEANNTLNGITTAPLHTDHDLRDFGFYNASLIGENSNIALYIAIDKSNFGRPSYVLLHKVKSDDEPLFDTRGVIGPRTGNVGPEFTEALGDILISSGVKLPQYVRLEHYIMGYHNPTHDRATVLGPNFAEPAHFTTHPHMYWENGALVLAPYGGSLANVEVLSRSDAIDLWGQSAQATLDDPFAMPDLGALPPEGPSAEYMANQAGIRREALRRGLVYKNDAFWGEFGSQRPRQIFEAYAQPVPLERGDTWGTVVISYLKANSDKCAHLIEDPYTYKVDRITTTDSAFGPLFSSSERVHDIIVPGRFLAELDRRFGENAKPFATSEEEIAFFVSIFLPDGIERMSQQFENIIREHLRVIADVDRFISQDGCGSPLHVHFEEMLFHVVSNQRPASLSLAPIPNAAAYTDELYRRGDAVSFRAACMLHKDFDERQIKWCDCATEKVHEVKPKRLNEYSSRFQKYLRDVKFASLRVTRGQDHPENRLAGIKPYCDGVVDR